MVTWAEFEAADPDSTAEGQRLLYARGDGEALLATVRGGDPPRIHPINAGIVNGEVYAFLLRSPKRTDLEHDGRYALHTHQDPADPGEFTIRGRARLVTDGATREAVGAAWFFGVDATYHLFAFSIETALVARRGVDEWPPRYTRWDSRS